jgi:hypothetical protein
MSVAAACRRDILFTYAARKSPSTRTTLKPADVPPFAHQHPGAGPRPLGVTVYPWTPAGPGVVERGGSHHHCERQHPCQRGRGPWDRPLTEKSSRTSRCARVPPGVANWSWRRPLDAGSPRPLPRRQTEAAAGARPSRRRQSQERWRPQSRRRPPRRAEWAGLSPLTTRRRMADAPPRRARIAWGSPSRIKSARVFMFVLPMAAVSARAISRRPLTSASERSLR